MLSGEPPDVQPSPHVEPLRAIRAAPSATSSPATAPSAIARRCPPEVAIAIALLVARVVYLAWFSSWELVGDEAHYWEWSRRPALSYYTKGPGIAWAIWLGRAAFGDTTLGVRFPSAIAAALTTLAGARLARAITGDGRAAVFAAVALALAPGLFATAQLATTDVFYSAAWMIAAGCLWHAIRADATPARRVLAWAAVGAAIGVGCLFKYTALFEIVGIATFLAVRRRDVAWDRATFAGIAVAIFALLLTSAPILVWNATHGWPTIAHQIGRLRLPGGDESVDLGWSPLWFPTFVGAQLGLLGVVGAALVAISVRRSRSIDGPAGTARAMLWWIGVPILAFYVLLSLFRETQGNWAIAAYGPLLVLVGIDAADSTRAAPRGTFAGLWRWYVGVGVVVAIVLLLGPGIARVPGVGRLDAMRKLAARVSGSAARADEISRLSTRLAAERAGRAPLIVARGYMEASLLAFYLPGHPRVYCAASHLGARPNAYDFFADTDLAAPSLRGDDAILVGGDPARWQRAFHFDSIDAAPGVAKTFVGHAYTGPTDRPTTERPKDGGTP